MPAPRLTLSAVAIGLMFAACGTARSAEPADDLARYDALVRGKDRRHWAFQPVRRPEVPAVADRAWARNPIDAFVLAKLDARGWKPNPSAEPAALLRRVYLDLTGLPPTPAEQDAFRNDPSPDALDRVVDRLLASPRYGERWGRHWLDVARYADSNGYERDAAKPGVWRYRDYVIRSFNDDKPYDRFVLEQIAGDELPDSSAETLTATGFHRLGPWDDEPADPAADRFDQLDDLVSTTAQAFLGLTLACARCHNHKFEPLTMHDYYRVAAVFAPLQRPRDFRTELDRPAGSRHEMLALARRNARVAPDAAAALTGHGPLPSVTAAAVAWDRTARVPRHLADLPRGYFLEEPSPAAPPTHLLARGSPSQPGPEVRPGVPAVLADRQPEFLPPDELTSRRRLSLAQWVASPANPLTARVIVNRVWMHHFGEGLVRTPSDFGTQADPPTHPELLDWLADRFVADGWSLKKLHRLVLASNAYRMSKRTNPEYAAADPDNLLLWRVSYRRLEVEAVRDSVLAVGGRLNPAMYGPAVFPEVPAAALEGHSDPDKIWPPFDEAKADRRTVYVFLKRSLMMPMLEALDLCDTARTAARRGVTTVAPQALTLFNGAFVNRQARHFAARLEKEAGPDPDRQIELAYRLALCRPPSEGERAALAEFLRREAGRRAPQAGEAEAHRLALAQVCRVVLNLNEFVYPD